MTTTPGWTDLATAAPGIRITHEAARRRHAEGPGADRSWRVGADGEVVVAGLLSQLTAPTPLERVRGRPGRWRVLHSVPLPRGDGRPSDIDHLLVGPPGVVTINTKHHRRGRVVIDGDDVFVGELATRYVPAARLEGEIATALLGAALGRSGAGALAARLPVRPFVTVVGGALWVERWPAGVTFTTDHGLVHALRSLPAQLTVDEVGVVYEQARRSSTWVGGVA